MCSFRCPTAKAYTTASPPTSTQWRLPGSQLSKEDFCVCPTRDVNNQREKFSCRDGHSCGTLWVNHLLMMNRQQLCRSSDRSCSVRQIKDELEWRQTVEDAGGWNIVVPISIPETPRIILIEISFWLFVRRRSTDILTVLVSTWKASLNRCANHLTQFPVALLSTANANRPIGIVKT